MRIISPKLLRDFWETQADAEAPAREWLRKAELAIWERFADVRQTFAAADLLTMASEKSGRDSQGKVRTKTIVIFNLGGNKFRLIASINYQTQIIYLLNAMTHAEYARNKWKRLI
jgi:mRNA interferase HigB